MLQSTLDLAVDVESPMSFNDLVWFVWVSITVVFMSTFIRWFLCETDPSDAVNDLVVSRRWDATGVPVVATKSFEWVVSEQEKKNYLQRRRCIDQKYTNIIKITLDATVFIAKVTQLELMGWKQYSITIYNSHWKNKNIEFELRCYITGTESDINYIDGGHRSYGAYPGPRQ